MAASVAAAAPMSRRLCLEEELSDELRLRVLREGQRWAERQGHEQARAWVQERLFVPAIHCVVVPDSLSGGEGRPLTLSSVFFLLRGARVVLDCGTIFLYSRILGGR